MTVLGRSLKSQPSSTSQKRKKKRARKPLLPSSTRPSSRHHPSSSNSNNNKDSTGTKHHDFPSRKSRILIRNHHTLTKQLAHAVKAEDDDRVRDLQKQLAEQGGLERYQKASLSGQSKDRGGDTGKVLVEWLSEDIEGNDWGRKKKRRKIGTERRRLRMLEVGALEVDSACARSGLFGGGGAQREPEQQINHDDNDGGGEEEIHDQDGSVRNGGYRDTMMDAGIERIDLGSRHPKIREADFMLLDPPGAEDEAFDVVSLSLVVNFVGDVGERGRMLKRVALFLKGRAHIGDIVRRKEAGIHRASISEHDAGLLPALFLVLPAPCVTNSRYLDESRLAKIMESLGYKMVKRKLSARLVYYLWRYVGVVDDDLSRFAKEEIRKGKDRNNFAIVLK